MGYFDSMLGGGGMGGMGGGAPSAFSSPGGMTPQAMAMLMAMQGRGAAPQIPMPGQTPPSASAAPQIPPVQGSPQTSPLAALGQMDPQKIKQLLMMLGLGGAEPNALNQGYGASALGQGFGTGMPGSSPAIDLSLGRPS